MFVNPLRGLSARVVSAVLIALAVGPSAHGDFIFADVVLDYFDSGAGPLPGTSPGGPGFPIPVSLGVVLGGEPGPTGFQDFLSLPTGSFVTVGFTGGTVTDGPGNDIFLNRPPGGASERANVLVSADGATFSLLGTAVAAGPVSAFDLASIGFSSPVVAIRIVGLDLGGASPGFEVFNVQANVTGATAVPEPGTLVLLGVGALGVLGHGWRQRRVGAVP